MGLATVGAVAWRFRRAESRAASLANLPAPVGEAPVEIHGHRGARGLLPENTLPAFEHALALGVDAVELDVGMTRDGVPVVHHDRRLDPDHTRDRSGAWLAPPGPLLRALDLEALAAFDVGRAAPGGETAKRFPRQTPCDGARVPALSEVLALAQRSGGRRFYFNIEVKLTPEAPDETAEPAEFARAVVTALCTAGVIDRARVQSFDWRVLAEVRRFAPEVHIGCLTAEQLWLDNLQRGRPGPSPWTAGLDIDAMEGSIPLMVKTFGCTAWSPFFPQSDGGGARRGAPPRPEGRGLDRQRRARHGGPGPHGCRRHRHRLPRSRHRGTEALGGKPRRQSWRGRRVARVARFAAVLRLSRFHCRAGRQAVRGTSEPIGPVT